MTKKLEVNKGDIYGRLTIIKETEQKISPCGSKRRMFMCECICGNKKEISLRELRTSNTKSCGCWNIESAKKRFTTFGLSKHPLHNTYVNITQRCLNKNHPSYKYYGGRGITISKRWLGTLGQKNFIDDMGERPSKKHSIDRIDNNKRYSKENCRWATMKQQCRNRRDTVLYRGECQLDASKRLGGNKNLVSDRLRRGWDKVNAFNKKVKHLKYTA